MKRSLLLCLCLALMGLAQSAGPRRLNRRSVLRQLTTDLDRAMDRATLKDKDRKKLDRARVPSRASPISGAWAAPIARTSAKR